MSVGFSIGLNDFMGFAAFVVPHGGGAFFASMGTVPRLSFSQSSLCFLLAVCKKSSEGAGPVERESPCQSALPAPLATRRRGLSLSETL